MVKSKVILDSTENVDEAIKTLYPETKQFDAK